VMRAAPVVAPHQPRLDWQMWFAALGDYRQNRWFVNFMVRLLEGEPSVLRLLQSNPFPAAPPKYVRAELYLYHFTRWGERAWWRREDRGIYFPPASLPMWALPGSRLPPDRSGGGHAAPSELSW